MRRFIAALTRGGPGGMPRPMEVHAHDPLRYLGDMLAWVHQSLASERDLFVALFGSDGASPADAASSRGAGRPSDTPEIEAEDGEGLPDTAALLDRVFESICRPLKVCRLAPGVRVGSDAMQAVQATDAQVIAHACPWCRACHVRSAEA